MKRCILHIDMNSFFATCEQQANALLRNAPVGVAAYAGENSILLAASIEAKRHGVKTGTSVRDARARCQNITILENDPPKYRAISEQVSAILVDYTDRIEPYSIDESFLDLTGWVHTWEEARRKAEEIKQRIRAEIGEWMSCSIGISVTKFLAKIGSDMRKPDGLTVITPGDLPDIYDGMELTDLWGVAHGWEKRLARTNIHTIRQLYDYPLQNLISLFGKPGHTLYAHLHGLDAEPVTSEESAPQSISHQYAIPKKECTPQNLPNILMRLCEKVGARLRGHELVAHSIFLGLRLYDHPGSMQHVRLPYPVRATRDIYHHTTLLFRHRESLPRIHVLAVGVSRLSRATNQLALFEPEQQNLASNHIDDIVDEINNKHGVRAITRANTLGSEQYVPDRIAFGK